MDSTVGEGALLGYFGSPWTLVAVGLSTCVVLLFIINEWNYYLCKSRGFNGPRPWPLVGNLPVIMREGVLDSINKWFNEYNGMFSFWFGGILNIVVNDQDILKEILVKDFGNFTDRNLIDTLPSPMDKGLFFIKGNDWKRARTILSPTFSASKLKRMNIDMNNCARTLTSSLLKHKGESVTMKNFTGAFSMDVISSTAFGIKTDSLNNPDEPFIKHVSDIFNPKQQRPSFFFLFAAIFGKWMQAIQKYFGICFAPRTSLAFFEREVKAMIKDRKENQPDMHDFLQLMINAEIDDDDANGKVAENKKKLTTDEIIGQAFLFFIAGYETVSTTLAFTSYELAINQTIQNRLLEEIRDNLDDKEDPTYDSVGKLKYMDQVLLETLRMYPAVGGLNREAAKDVTIKGVTIPKGVCVRIPVYQLHHDPDIYEDPEVFKPERFDTRKPNDKQIDHIPFGFGPRICIGMRLALVEAKIALVHVLRKVKLSKGPETEVPLQLKEIGVINPKNPIKLLVESR